MKFFKHGLSVDENILRCTYEADRDEWIDYVKVHDPSYFADKKSATAQTIAWLCTVKLMECPLKKPTSLLK